MQFKEVQEIARAKAKELEQLFMAAGYETCVIEVTATPSQNSMMSDLYVTEGFDWKPSVVWEGS